MKKRLADVGASVRARLLAHARERKEDFQLVLTRYANERLLHRLSRSRHASEFVLKGATLFTVWTGEPHRATRDVDLLGYGPPSVERLRSVFAEIIATDVDDDGVDFDAASLEVAPIRDQQLYSGIRLVLVAHVTTARVRLQFDVGFGDVITPGPIVVKVPSLLDAPPPTMRAYPRETVVAEKLEAMVMLGLANSRMKDFYDLVVLAQTFEFRGRELAQAIAATFARRTTPLPAESPVGLTPTFTHDEMKQTQWEAFLRKSSARRIGDLPSVAEAIAEFAWPALEAARDGSPFERVWNPGGPWT